MRPLGAARVWPGTHLSREVSQSESGAGDEFELGIRKLQTTVTAHRDSFPAIRRAALISPSFRATPHDTL